jgi:hypothetical protein
LVELRGLELDNPRKVDPLEQSEKLISLRNSLDFVKNILKSPERRFTFEMHHME